MIWRLVNSCRAGTTGAFRIWFGDVAIQWQTGQKTRNFFARFTLQRLEEYWRASLPIRALHPHLGGL